MNRITYDCGRLILDDHPEDFLTYRKGSGESIELLDIAVNSQRGVGRGSQLVDLLKRVVTVCYPHANRLFAFTRASNSQAHGFYRKNGLRHSGTVEDFYDDDLGSEAAYIFVLALDS